MRASEARTWTVHKGLRRLAWASPERHPAKTAGGSGVELRVRPRDRPRGIARTGSPACADDRRADGWELLPLAADGVDSLSLDMHVEPRFDDRGNCSRERSIFTVVDDLRAQVGAGAKSRPAGALIDVYLACP